MTGFMLKYQPRKHDNGFVDPKRSQHLHSKSICSPHYFALRPWLGKLGQIFIFFFSSLPAGPNTGSLEEMQAVITGFPPLSSLA